MNIFSLQLHTLKNCIDCDNFFDTLLKLKEYGYSSVEACENYGLLAEEIREYAEKADIDICGYHINMLSDFHSQLDFAVELGCEFVVYPNAKVETVDDAVKLGCALRELSEKAIMRGLRFCYHNHDSEFKKTDDGLYLFDIIAENAGDICEFEFDIGWIKFAGADPYEFMRSYAGRTPLLHLRQIKDGEFCALAHGDIDLKSIISLGDRFGVEHYIVEFPSSVDALEDAENSAKFIKEL